jgi:hypothetical protein
MGIATTGSIPRRDPYSFTARGHPWVVQSWLPEWTYGWLNRVGVVRLVVLEQAVLMALVAVLMGRLARAGTPLRTAAATGVALAFGALWWSQRPLLFGLVAFALTALVVERKRSPWLLVPIVWFWVSSHGSFPLGLVWIGAVGLGATIDDRRLPRDLLRYAGAFVAGLLVSVVNPLGPRLVAFPVTIEAKHKVFATVAEWMSPSFQGALGLVTLAAFIASLLILFRQRPPWRDAVPYVVFVALGLIALRNLPVAAIAIAPVLGRALTPRTPPAPRIEEPRVNALFAFALAAAIGISAIGIFGHDGLSQSGYPTSAVRYMERQGLLSRSHRVAAQDIVGCYLILLRGEQARVFIDDRVDMYPVAVSNDYDTLLHGFPGALAVLDSHSIDVVLWDSRQPLVGVLGASGAWEKRVRLGVWEVWVRR